MSETKIAEILAAFSQKIPEKPDWIVLSSISGALLGAVNVDIGHEERYPPVFPVVMLSFAERVGTELGIGQYNFSILAGVSGFVLVTSINNEFVLGIKFRSNGTSIGSVTNITDSLSPALEDLSAKLRNYSP
jgi:predicted regulator of Ras-like GTPase activity (Roadblock/LC7/MglB family)